MTTTPLPSRSQRLKAATATIHDTLDRRIMALDPFSSTERYIRFLRAQQAFHAALAPLYAAPYLRALIPDLAERDRSAAIVADLADLGASAPVIADADPVEPVDMSTALGWLYVAEGSSLGAAFLLKAAQQIGLSTDHGARHLAGHPEGRAAHWRRFTARIDAADMTPEQEDRMIAAARDAFARFRALADAAFA
ncbi:MULTISPECIES: biliverdin-producing heme oxygenase [unclassified Sphingomonas]|uniref:biliverdin-producing heme oxygenase n=1 Tax=unclassified Sphingomonas TaxID=196159 RepID=UPI0006F7047A|nr:MULTISPECIES: biliverdin-producing heme oxygenase [unclassified Sphingomonas]KQM28639.1 heme oxygenase [Sphingomonas sp. Leaf9]KQM45342.1 heme oxygenase [Sphingomonas sp. Leaf11]